MQGKLQWMTVLSLAALCACTQKPPPYKPLATLEEVMHQIVIPNAEIVWKSTGSIVTVKGTEEFQPSTPDEWFEVESSATILMEAGNLLMMDGRAKDNKKWMDRARALVDAGDSVRQAAKAHDAAALFERGGYLFDACQGCHFEFRFEADPKTIRTH
jgi:hypothetical protein